MRRREFISLFTSVALAWPLTAGAQQPSQPVVGYLGLTSPKGEAEMMRSFRKGLGEAGFDEGRNVTVEFRFAEGDVNRLPALAAELVRRNVSVILAGTTLGAVAAKTLLQTNRGISQFRGEWLEFRGRKLLATYHPAYLLRNPPAKREVWDDLQKVMALLGLKVKKTSK